MFPIHWFTSTSTYSQLLLIHVSVTPSSHWEKWLPWEMVQSEIPWTYDEIFPVIWMTLFCSFCLCWWVFSPLYCSLCYSKLASKRDEIQHKYIFPQYLPYNSTSSCPEMKTRQKRLAALLIPPLSMELGLIFSVIYFTLCSHLPLLKSVSFVFAIRTSNS